MSVVVSHPRPIAAPAAAAAPSPPIRVLVADDHAAVRRGVQRLLDDRSDIQLTAVVASGREAIAVAASRPVDVAVLDYQLGSGQDGLAVTTTLKSFDAPPRVLIYSVYADAPLALAAALAGADGVLDKAGLGDDLCEAIRRVSHGRQVRPAIPEDVIASVADQLRLTPRERGLVRLVVLGEAAGPEIAAALGMSEREVRERRRAIVHAMTGPAGRARLPWDDGQSPLDR